MVNVFYFDLREGSTDNFNTLSDKEYIFWDQKSGKMKLGDFCLIYFGKNNQLFTTKIIEDDIIPKEENGKWHIKYNGKSYPFETDKKYDKFFCFKKISSYSVEDSLKIGPQSYKPMLLPPNPTSKFHDNIYPKVIKIIKDPEILNLLEINQNTIKDQETNNNMSQKNENVERNIILEKYEDFYNNGQIEFITFHPSYSYEDFVEGIRPELNKNDSTNVNFIIGEGVFKKICARALYASVTGKTSKDVTWSEALEEYDNSIKEGKKIDWNQKKFVLIIDEINRGDTSRVLGELITLLEEDKRIGSDECLWVNLPYSSEKFSIPKNLHVIGTMNTADRSLALVDIALRRRFDFNEMLPNFKLFDIDSPDKNYPARTLVESKNKLFKNSVGALIKINESLMRDDDIGKDKQIGHSFLCKPKEQGEIFGVWNSKIFPLLEEYYFFDKDKLSSIMGNFYDKHEGWKVDEKNFEEFLKKTIGNTHENK
jgi:hypothetical protein